MGILRRQPWLLAPLAFAAVVVVALAWYLGSPLFISQTVNEEFPAAATAPAPTAARAPSTPAAQPTAVAAASPTSAPAGAQATRAPVAAVAPTASPQPATAVPTMAPAPTSAPESGPKALLAGSFQDAGDGFHKGSGRATIYDLGEGKRVLRLEDFQTTNGPDLYVVLAGVPQPKSSAEVHEPVYVELSRLKGNIGNQNYDVPADVDLSAVKSVVIYCRRFTTVFSTAALSPAG